MLFSARASLALLLAGSAISAVAASDVATAEGTSPAAGTTTKRGVICWVFGCNDVDYNTSTTNCGGANNACPSSYKNQLVGAKVACTAGVCNVACATGYGFSSKSQACIDTTSDANNCGGVGSACFFANANPTCKASKCAIASCTDNTYKISGSSCVKIDTLNDEDNCGVYGRACPASYANGSGAASCVAGVCRSSCATGYGFDAVNQKCQSITDSPTNCGTVGYSCPSANGVPSCSNKVCSIKCNDNYKNVGGACVPINYANDTSNCGTAGKTCPSSYANGVGSICSGGQCMPVTCKNANAAFSASAGDCVSTQTVSDCGALGRACPSTIGTPTCSSGTCAYSACSSGYTLTANKDCQQINTDTDVKNCGKLNSPCPLSYSNGQGVQCVAGSCRPVSCDDGYTYDASISGCRGIKNDVSNCGALGKVCPSSNGTPSCANGTCSIKCNTDYKLGTSGSCEKIDYNTDKNNCGSANRVCPASFANGTGSICSGGTCMPTDCNDGYDFSFSSGSCIRTSDDIKNCGAVGNACPAVNGVATCSSGSCGIKCNTDYKSVGGACQKIDYKNDMNNCGTAGTVCPASYANGGAGTCSNGACSTTCNNGYTFNSSNLSCVGTTSDPKNCGSIGKVCPSTNGTPTCSNGSCGITCNKDFKNVSGSCQAIDYKSDMNNCGTAGTVCPASYANGGAGTCSNGACKTTCNTGYAFSSSSSSCLATTSDVNNCGAVGAACKFPLGGGECQNSKCVYTSCSGNYELVGTTCQPVDVTSDVDNCGKMGNACSFMQGAKGICLVGRCTYTGCPTGYSLSNNQCNKLNGSQRARAKKASIPAEKRALCPAGESACPIVGSLTFEMGKRQEFTSAEAFTNLMRRSGGFECIDTAMQLDSCGGCASTGEGQDCTKLDNAVGVGCDAGACVVFSCSAGYRPNLTGTKCVKALRDAPSGHNASTLEARHLHHGHHRHRRAGQKTLMH